MSALVLRSWAAADSDPCGDLPSDRLVALPPKGFHRRKARLPTLAVALAQHALGDRVVPPQTAVLFGTARGCQTETIAFVEHMIQADEATPKPRAFSASVHNAPAAQVAIALGAQGQNQTFVHGALSLLHAVFAAQRQPDPVLLGLVDERTAYDDLARGRCLNHSGTTPAAAAADAPTREGGLALWLEPALPQSGDVVLGPVAFARPRDPDAWLARHLADAPRSVVGGGDALAPGLALLRALPTLTRRHAIVVRSRFGEVGCLILERAP